MDLPSLFGIPLPLIGFFCFLLAGLFVYAWPKPAKNSSRGVWATLGLHYLNPLAWVLLGMAAFWQNRDPQTAIIIAAIGGVVFLFFVILWVREAMK